MIDFTHISLPNPGVTAGNLPEEIYGEVMKEVNEISSDFNSLSTYNNGLAGNIERQYELQKSISILNLTSQLTINLLKQCHFFV